jgi:hypothetical protein
MSYTGKLGTPYSKPDDILLGSITVGVAQEQDVGQSLALSQSATVVVDRECLVSQTLVFTEFLGTIYPETVPDTLAFLDAAVATVVFGRNVTQTLDLVQDVLVTGPIYLSVQHNLNLTDEEVGHLGVINKFVADEIVFSQSAGRVLEQTVSQSISFTQLGERTNAIDHTLSLVQSVVVGRGGDAEDELDLVQVLTVQGIFVRSASDNLALQQSVGYYLTRLCTEKQYSPFVGSSTDTTYTPPSIVVPTLNRTTLTLTHPYVAPTTTLVLRNPQFNDKDRLNFNRINRETRGGTLIVFADPKWPKTQTLAVQIDALSQAKAANLIDFLRDSLGQEIGLLDWDGRQWRGIITTPEAEVTDNGPCDKVIVFEFQGELA